ncbi:hypothetical protein C8F04DRAFT_63226 [Mycena alexandri]|uniref:F-box domain-containing protein n=1 Tax=Mycena alexandri TaxID=1745969 RepID=A0AAD6WXQ9_9AGAR|nr:hypothetical protein C8F04DRAFT_63226 [Mycena alexandri]
MLPELHTDRIRAADLDAQIFELERSLCAIRAQKALVQKRLDSYKYPVLTLPNEIISEIFVHFLPVYPACPPLTGILSPTNLTQICRKWRELALATPLLWRAIRLAFDPTIPLPQHTQKIDTWLSMSGCCPTSVEIPKLGGVQANDSRTNWESKVLVVLAPHHGRCEHLKLKLDYLPRDRRLLPFTRPMPLLRHLDFTVKFIREDDSSDPFVFVEAPLLFSVVLDRPTATKFILPWAQLTSMTLGPLYPSECAAVLKKTPNLVHCKLDFIAGNGSALPNLIFLRLESLILDGWHMSMDSGNFDLPALRKLQITEFLLRPNPCHSLASFLSKSRCKLPKICINGPREISKDTYHAAFPSTEFSFDGKYVREGIDVASHTDPSDVEDD